MSVWSLSLDDLVKAIGGTALSRGLSPSFFGVGTDTRKDLSGQIFFALKGEAFDANDFLDKAAVSGAAAIVAHRVDAAEALAKARGAEIAVILVDDTLRALQALGLWWRRRMKAKILGVTGTNGKTTTKEFAAAILSTRFRTQWSKGSFNNHWGVPITLLSIEPSHKAAMVEMGMNHLGELKHLVRIAEPDVVACTMVGRGHLEGMGSIEGVARGKAEIYEHAKSDALFIFNVDNEYTRRMMDDAIARDAKRRILAFGEPTLVAGGAGGLARGLDVCLRVESATDASLVVSGHVGGEAGRAEVPVFGAHNVTNLMAASCFALAAGMTPSEIWKALPECRTAWGRNQWVELKSGARALFDAYNANPESMTAAIQNFASLSARGRKFAILGEMRELGEHAERAHQEIGAAAADAGFEAIAFVGPSHRAFASGAKAAGFAGALAAQESYEPAVAREIAAKLRPGDVILFKGSRGMSLEKAMQEFEPVEFKGKA